MALHSGLMSRLCRDETDEPLPKRLKLAENVIYSSDIPIAWKEDCIFRWFFSELSDDDDNTAVWTTVQRCLSVNPKTFSRLSLETRNLLTERIIQCLNGYPDKNITQDIVKCCAYIFSIANVQNYIRKNNQLYLMKALINFALKVLNCDESSSLSCFPDKALAVESVDYAISTIVQINKQNFSDKKDLAVVFIEELLFPLSSLVATIKAKKISTKLITENKKCIKALIFSSFKNIATASNEAIKMSEEIETLFQTLKGKLSATDFEQNKAVVTSLFENVINTYRQNSTLVDIILRKLWKCIVQKEQSKQVLAILLDHSRDVSFNFDYEIDDCSLKLFLENQIRKIKSKKSSFQCCDYELLTAITKLNPLLVENEIQSLLERMLFEVRASEQEAVAYENLLTELWTSTVRLRRQHKFLSKFLLAFIGCKDKATNDESVGAFKLPNVFLTEFSKDLKIRTTSAQILAIFNTLIFHLKADCVNGLESSLVSSHTCLAIQIVGQFIVALFEHVNFLDCSLTNEWQMKFYQTFTDLQATLSRFSMNFHKIPREFTGRIFVAFAGMVKIWCEAYDLLRYYVPDVAACKELDFPISEAQFKSHLKRTIDENVAPNHLGLLNELVLYKSIFYDKANEPPIEDKIIGQLWPVIIENHFEIIESFNETQLLKLTSSFVKEACRTESNSLKWSLVLKENTSRISQVFATATALQITCNLTQTVRSGSIKAILDNIDLAEVLRSMRDQKDCKKALKCASKLIARQDFQAAEVTDPDNVKRTLVFVSKLPLSILDSQLRKLLFLLFYTFDEETKDTVDFRDSLNHAYTDLFTPNDFDLLNNLSKPLRLINHFKNDEAMLFKIFKSSTRKLSTLSFLHEFADTQECNQRISSILLISIESSRNKGHLTDCKESLQSLSLKLSNKIINETKEEEVRGSYEVAALRVIVKTILSEKRIPNDNLKICIELTLENIMRDTNTLHDDKLMDEIFQLTLIILKHRESFNITEDLVKNLCIVYINNPNGKLLFHFLEVLRDSEFQFFINYFNKRTKESLLNGNAANLEKLIKIWESLSKAETKVARAKALKATVNNLFKDLLALEIKEDLSCLFLLRICRTLVTSKRMIRLTHILVDSIFVASMDCLNHLGREVKLTACQEALGLSLDFMRSKQDFVLDRLSMLTNLFRKIIKTVFEETRETEFRDDQMLKILAVDIEKFCTFFAKLRKDVVRISPYLIADLIQISRSSVLPQFLKVSIDFSISHLLSNCDRHAISYLSRTLPTSSQQVFKTAHHNYVKFNKFTGKI